MDARPRLGRSGKRLALATCAIALVAAAFSGPALADPGLSALLSDVTEALPPAVGDPVDDVGSSVEPTLEPAVEQVQAQVDAAVAAVEQTTELVDETVSDGLAGVEQTVDGTLGTVDATVGAVSGASGSPSSPSPAASVSPSSPAAPADTVAVVPLPAAEATTSEVARRLSDATLPADRVGRPHVLEPVPPGVLARASKGPAPPSATHSVLIADVPAAVGKRSRGDGATPRSPEPPSHGNALDFEWLVPQPPAPALLIATLLGLLALVVPRSGGRRLHPAVALLRPADARFRLVRPG